MGKYRQTLTLNDATVTGDGKSIGTDDFYVLWKLRVPAQQKKCFGYGAIQGGVDDRGVIYLDVKNNGGSQMEGYIRLEVRNANEDVRITIFEDRTERLRGSKTDLTQAFRLGETRVWAREDSYLVISMKADSSATFSKSNSDFLVPVTTITQ